VSRSRRWTGWIALAALVVPVALSVAAWLVWSGRAHDAESTRTEDRAALDAATLETLNWASVDYRKADDFVTRVKQGATGKFLQQFEQSEKALRTLIRQNRSVQVPSIPKDGAALLERRGSEARVLIVMDANVTNTSTSTPQPRQYRLQVTVTKVDGRWLTSNLEFVDATA
jgi:Mce-associated membrane protein